MATVFREAGVPHPELELVQSAAQVKAFAQRVGYPLVLKPDVGVGAAHTFKVTSDAEVDKALAQPLPSPYVAQAFVQGTIVTYDGLVDHDGHILLTLSHEYSDGVMEVVTEKRDISFWSLKDLPPALDALGRKAVAALGLRERWFHLEFFRLPDDTLHRARGQPAAARRLHDGHDELRLRHRRVPALGPRRHRRSGNRPSATRPSTTCVTSPGAPAAPTATATKRCCASWGPRCCCTSPSLPPVYQAAMGTEMYLTRHEDLELMHEDVRFIQALR